MSDPVACLPASVGDLEVASAGDLVSVAGVELVFWDGRSLPDRAGEIGFVVAPDRFRSPELLAQFDALEVVQTVSAGVDRVRPHVPEGVVLCNANGVHGGAVAEWVLAAILAVLRDIPSYAAAQACGQWTNHTAGELAGQRVLIVGAGDLGRETARRLEPFDVTLTLVARSARDGIHAMDELPALLARTDVVIVVVPLTDETRGMVDARFLAAMPDGAILVNAARGAVADTDALLAQARSGRLRLILDVTDPEPLPAEHPLWRIPGVLITPHVAGNVPGFPHRALRLVRDQLERWRDGEPLANVVSGSY
ncbi:MAG TPA: 2-hydroxyacid dehydrogenase [Solirubrobacteraceae bacterium]|nr:2-hydroxyacid dehydrogenase [Solirubrobacteraceae bacterium]